MSLTRNEIYTLIYQLKGLLEKAKFQSIKEIEPFKWILCLTKDQTQFFLLLCFKAPFVRFHLLSSSPDCYASSFSLKLTSYLKQSEVKQIDGVNKDRILMITFESKGSCFHLIGEFFPQRPNLYLVDEKMNIIHSINPVEVQIYQPPENPRKLEKEQIEGGINHLSIEEKFEQLEKEQSVLQTKKMIQNHLSLMLKKAQKLKQKLTKDLEQCLQWPKIQHEAMLLQSHIFKIHKGMKEVFVNDWENDNIETVLSLDHSLSPKEQIARRFQQSKKLRLGIEHHEKNLLKIEKDLEHFATELKLVEEMHTLDDLKSFSQKVGLPLERNKKQINEKKRLPYYEFKTESGLKIWVGKNAHANEQLTFRYAKGSDYWLHVSDLPGSHVVLRVEKKQEPDHDSLLDAVQLALVYSKAKEKGEADLCLTQCKYVSRFGRNSPGKVQISKHKMMHAKVDSLRFQKIKERNN
jgi:predicted ribosome quality control (RQC) complex YloA/Tae2 family protein